MHLILSTECAVLSTCSHPDLMFVQPTERTLFSNKPNYFIKQHVIFLTGSDSGMQYSNYPSKNLLKPTTVHILAHQ